MATGKPLIFTSLVIGTNTSNALATTTASFELPDDENTTITNEIQEALVEGGQTLLNYFNQGLEIVSYDMTLVDGSSTVTSVIQTNSTVASKGSILLQGATGSVEVEMNDVRIVASRPFNDLQRDHVLVKVTKSSTSGITVRDA